MAFAKRKNLIILPSGNSSFLRLGLDFEVRANLGRAGCYLKRWLTKFKCSYWFWRAFNFYEAHAAIAGNR